LLWAPSSSFSLSSPSLSVSGELLSLPSSITPYSALSRQRKVLNFVAYLYHVLLCQAFVIMLGVFASMFGKIMGCL
jgi:hypothetical protein